MLCGTVVCEFVCECILKPGLWYLKNQIRENDPVCKDEVDRAWTSISEYAEDDIEGNYEREETGEIVHFDMGSHKEDSDYIADRCPIKYLSGLSDCPKEGDIMEVDVAQKSVKITHEPGGCNYFSSSWYDVEIVSSPCSNKKHCTESFLSFNQYNGTCRV